MFRYHSNPLYRLGKFGWIINILINLPRLIYYRWLLFSVDWRKPDLREEYPEGMFSYCSTRAGFARYRKDVFDNKIYFNPERCTVCGSTNLAEKTTDRMDHIVLESDLICKDCGSKQGEWVTGYWYYDFVAEELVWYINAGGKLLRCLKLLSRF